MKRGTWGVALSALVLSVCLGAPAWAGSVGGDAGIGSWQQGAMIAGVGDYDWWYGCTPTSTGMLLSVYDRVGYAGYVYGNLIPGGVAELETFTGPPTGSAALASNAIASPGHISDFYGGGYGASGDDVAGPFHAFNCLADFMGTSQDSVSASNGGTWLYYFSDGSPFTMAYALAEGVQDNSGMYGIAEYIAYAGYGVKTLYNQLIEEGGQNYGFSLAQYIAEIDAGRPVLIHTENHTLCGVGYNEQDPTTIYVHDTWSLGPHTMTWGGTYGGKQQWGVTVLELEAIPEPATVLGIAAALTGLAGYLRRRAA
ncbi:MAG TPA: PEP-CTERM sorting domain-containing protein [Phycisphaerae bacterium]|nr:PEP-CTERM sorting domain-containing protein [Phycisphaerae bacterium]